MKILKLTRLKLKLILLYRISGQGFGGLEHVNNGPEPSFNNHLGLTHDDLTSFKNQVYDDDTYDINDELTMDSFLNDDNNVDDSYGYVGDDSYYDDSYYYENYEDYTDPIQYTINDSAYYVDYYDPDNYQDESEKSIITGRKFSIDGFDIKKLPANRREWSKEQLKNRQLALSLNKYKASPWGMVSLYKSIVKTSKKRLPGPAILARKFIDYGCWCFQTSSDEIPARMPTTGPYDEACKNLVLCEKCVEMDNEDGDPQCSTSKKGKYPEYNAAISPKGEITCTDDLNSCEHAYCECHKQFALSLPKDVNGNRKYMRHTFMRERKLTPGQFKKLEAKEKRERLKAEREAARAAAKENKNSKNGKSDSGPLRSGSGNEGGELQLDYYSDGPDLRRSRKKTQQRKENNRIILPAPKVGFCVVPHLSLEDARRITPVIVDETEDPLDTYDKKYGPPRGNGGRFNFDKDRSTGGRTSKNPKIEKEIDWNNMPFEPRRKKPTTCCGVYPYRFPYSEDETHKCCGGKTYNTDKLACCGYEDIGILYNPLAQDCCRTAKEVWKIKGIGSC